MGEIVTEYFVVRTQGQSQNSVISFKLCFISKRSEVKTEYKYTSMEV